jgi:tRNA-dihydrouridine synthase
MTSKEYRKNNFKTCKEDSPLIAQFCGDDKECLLEACKIIEGDVAGVDLNLGCPQGAI